MRKKYLQGKKKTRKIGKERYIKWKLIKKTKDGNAGVPREAREKKRNGYQRGGRGIGRGRGRGCAGGEGGGPLQKKKTRTKDESGVPVPLKAR